MNYPDWFDFDDRADQIAETGAEDAYYRGEADLTNYPDQWQDAPS